jgi:hypothetical protein
MIMKALSILIVLPLAGCAGWMPVNRHSVLPPTPAHISDKLKRSCGELSTIPDRDLTQAESNPLWAQDRRVGGCALRQNKALIKAAEALEKQGQKQ